MVALMVLELVVFEFLWFMMVWSHIYTMTHQPGFIPKRHTYVNAKLTPIFQAFVEEHSVYKEKQA